nr:adomet-dependent rrna methyltransferase spb1 [Quercus suber]
MAIQKKHAKARLDKYYYLAKEKGYRARAAFKLIQLNKKFGFLQQSKCLIDLCAAPGSWLQVAAETMPVKSLIVGVDLTPIKPIPKTITFQGDITTDKTRAIIRGHLKSWKADTVIHDGAPNVGTAWVQDAFSQNELVLCSLKLATEFLAPNGNFVTKVFRSKDSAKLEWIFKQLFAKVDQTKPPSSRNVSAETFYVCRGFKAPKNLDPRFLDPRHAFAEVEEAAVNMEARVFNPEKKKRKRDGYEEGDWTQFHEVSASDFVQTQDPIAMLGALNKIHFRQDGSNDISQTALERLPETSEEVRLCCDDLKVLGRKEFKLLLRWRLKARDRFGMRTKKPTKDGDIGEGLAGEEVATLESMDEEMKLQEELQNMTDKQSKIKRKERRKENERKNKEIVRMQMNMTTPTEIGIEAGGPDDGTFRLKDVDKAGIGRDIARGRMHTALESEKVEESEEEAFSDADGDLLERELDGMYEQYQERKEDRDTKARAKRARQKGRGDDQEDFEGFSGEEKDEDESASSGDDLLEDDDDETEDDVDGRGQGRLLSDLQPKDERKGGLTRRAVNFFEQDLFQGLGDLGEEEEDQSQSDENDIPLSLDKELDSGVDVASPSDRSHVADDDDDESLADFGNEEEDDATSQTSSATIEGVPQNDDEENWESGDEAPATTTDEGRPNIDIITAEAMTLAHALATGKTTKHQLLDDNFNKFSHRDTDGLPEWFLDDENKHSKMVRPISAEAAKAIQEKTKALNARPIKKVREAKARKTLRTARRLEKLKKKSEGLAEGDELSEKDKANNIAALMAKAKSGGAKKKRPAVKVVRAGGQNKGAGRPKGVKGKYKMVDPRLKKDVRGLKRAEKKQKNKKSR